MRVAKLVFLALALPAYVGAAVIVGFVIMGHKWWRDVREILEEEDV